MYVVGVDGSARSDAALRWAIEAAARLRCPVLAVRVWPGTSELVRDSTEVREKVRREQEALDASVARGLAGFRNPPLVAKELREGDPATELADAADETMARAIVVGHSGLGGLEATVLGSVARRCVADAGRTVVVVPFPAPATARGRVAVGVTDDPASVDAVEWAAGEAAARGAVLVAVRASEGIAFADPEVVAHYEAELVRRVVTKALHPDPDRVPVEYVVTDGDTVAALLAAAQEADLLVVGARTSGLLAQVVPTTTIRCVEEAPVPVAVVRT